jgi:hypothetical protein
VAAQHQQLPEFHRGSFSAAFFLVQTDLDETEDEVEATSEILFNLPVKERSFKNRWCNA